MIIQIKEGLRMLKRAREVHRHGFKRYEGSVQEICRKIIDDAYNKEMNYFMVSAGHFCEFYIRDFAFCCEALMRLGYSEKVRNTLIFAMTRFARAKKITTAINPEGIPFDYHMPSGPESIALLLFSLRVTGNQDLCNVHREFLQQQINRVPSMMNGLLPRTEGDYSTIRDQARRKAACYDAVMIAVLAREAKLLQFSFPHTQEEVTQKIIEEYWNGTYFFQDLQKQDIVVGDANVFPFWTGIITDKKMLENAVTAMRAARLDQPMPLRYVTQHDKRREKTGFHFSAWLAPDYETDSIWMHLGLAYLQIVAYDKELQKAYLDAYTKKIMLHKNFLEVYDNSNEPLRGRLYVTDESMVWCANYLDLLQR